MVYIMTNNDFCNSKYQHIVSIAIKYSEHFGYCTFKGVHKKNINQSYYDFLSVTKPFEEYLYDFILPNHYERGQKFYVCQLNKATEQLIYSIGSFRDWCNWYIYNRPEDLAFYHNKQVWFRCISHEEMILVNTRVPAAIRELELLGVEFRQKSDDNKI